MLRVVLPLSLAFTGVLVALYVWSDDPRFAVGRVFDSPDQRFTWVGFATWVTVTCGASLTLVTNVADLCRYTPMRRDMRTGLAASAVLSIAVTTFVGGYAAAATGETNPFVAVTELTSRDALLALLLAAIVVQTIAANITNVYTAGLSLVNAAPVLGRFRATVLVAAAAVGLSAFPDLVTEAQDWIVHLGNVAAPLAGVVVADYLVLKRMRIDVADAVRSRRPVPLCERRQRRRDRRRHGRRRRLLRASPRVAQGGLGRGRRGAGVPHPEPRAGGARVDPRHRGAVRHRRAVRGGVTTLTATSRGCIQNILCHGVTTPPGRCSS